MENSATIKANTAALTHSPIISGVHTVVTVTKDHPTTL